MSSIVATDEKTGRKFTLDEPSDYKPGDKVLVAVSGAKLLVSRKP